MTVNYTTLLGLAQPVTGTEAGTWGTVVNNEITALVEEAIARGTSINVTAGDVTLTTTTGASNQARNAILLITGTPGVSRNVIAPSSSKVYIIVNGSNAAVVIKGAATTGVTVATGATSLVAWNGSDFVEVGQAGDVDGPASSTANAIARFSGTTGKIIQNSGITIDASNNVTGMGTLSSGAITSSSLTSGRVLYAGTSGLIQDSANLTFNGTTLTANTIGAFTLGGTISGGGNQINNIVIGASTPLAGSFTTLSASGVATFSAGTVSAPAITTTGDTNTGIFFPAADTIAFAEGGVESMRIDSSGNLGLGVTPSAWGSADKAIQVGAYTSLANDGNGALALTSNAYESATNTWRYIASLGASRYRQNFGDHSWFIAPSGTAGNTITWTQAMTLDASGNLCVGSTSAGNAGTINVSIGNPGTTVGGLQLWSTTSAEHYIQWGDSTVGSATYAGAISYAHATDFMRFWTASTERMRIDSSGNVGIGTSSPSSFGKLAIRGGITVNAGTTSITGTGFSTSDAINSTFFINHTSGCVNLISDIALTFWGASGSGVAERMRIDSSGNVGIGTNSPSTYGKFVTYSSGGYAGINTDGQVFSYQLLDITTAGGRLIGGSSQGVLGSVAIEQTATGAKGGYVRFNTCASGTNTETERMRIDSSGRLIVGATSTSDDFCPGSFVATNSAGTMQFSIRNNATATNTTADLLLQTWNGTGTQAGAARIRCLKDSSTFGTDLLFLTTTGSGGNTTERARIPAAGGFQCVNSISVGNATPTTSGAGITFPATQSASTDANTLDDYEEGTWTPVLNFGGSAGVTTYAQQNGTYTKVGNTVTVRGYFSITTKSAATGNADLAGLPFATKSGTAQYHTAYIYMNSQSITGAPMCYIGPNATNAELGQTNGSSGFVTISNTNFSNGGDFIFQATYLTA